MGAESGGGGKEAHHAIVSAMVGQEFTRTWRLRFVIAAAAKEPAPSLAGPLADRVRRLDHGPQAGRLNSDTLFTCIGQ